MANIRDVEPVVRICAIISRYDEVRSWAETELTRRWGEIFLRSPLMPFTAGGFYDSEMGSELKKTIIAFRHVCDPAPLADWKHETNQLESGCASLRRFDCKRPLNLDPGYVTQAKLVLATTKDRDHRIYLGRGIFAEVTLSFVHGAWADHRWTYPDYRTYEVKQFSSDCREHLREQIKEMQAFREQPNVG